MEIGAASTVEIGLVVSLLGAVFSTAFFIGRLSQRVKQVEDEQLDARKRMEGLPVTVAKIEVTLERFEKQIERLNTIIEKNL